MRNLTNSEISQLQQQHCTAENWQNIFVDEYFSCEEINNTIFSGKVILDEHVKISRCEIANYHIKNGSVIKNVNSLTVEGESTFGNGIEVSVLNEAGGREVKIFDRLSAHIAYILTLYRHRPMLIEKLNILIDKYVSEQTAGIGIIGEKSKQSSAGACKIGRFLLILCHKKRR